jgi:ABC-2 type transport system ATP-binding protein
VGEFSKGMQRRLGLAQALINDPELLILDEPTSGLDPVGAREVKDLVLELRRRGVTVFLSSHLLADVEEVCDRVAILHAGRLQALGPIAELLAVSGRQVFETERLEPATVEKLRELLRREEGKAIERVETPRKRLEAYFLEIVGRAAAGAGAEAGVAWALKVPEFLGRSTGWQPDGAEIPVSSGGP